METFPYFLLAGVFCLGYLGIALEHPLKVDKAATALLTAVACWVILIFAHAANPDQVVLHLGEHLQDIAQIIFFLIGALTIVHLMEVYGGFQIVVDLIRTRNRRGLLWIVSLVTFFLAPILGLLPTAIVMVSLLGRLISERDDRLIFSGMVIIAANAGGAWSPIGDVTTTMLWIGGRVSALRLITELFLPSLVSVLVPLIFLSWGLRKGDVPVYNGKAQPMEFGAKRVFFLGLGALLFVPVFKALTGLPPFIGILLGLGIVWLVTDRMFSQDRAHLKASQVLTRVDFPSLLFFLGILLAVAALQTGGVLKDLAVWMERYFFNQDLIVTTIGLTSAIVDNVPLTAAVMGMYDLARYPMDHRIWEMLAYAVGTGGSVLIIGSAAGVVVMGMEKITFGWYLMRVSLPVLLGYLAGIGTYILIAPH